jgi:iron(III) transport system permease protein
VVRPVWQVAAVLIALAALVPAASLAWIAMAADGSHWEHLVQHVLPAAMGNTAVLLAGVGMVVTVVGTACAWVVTAYDFPGRRTLTWALLLPLAMPTYIVAFVYLDMLHPIGPFQGLVRSLLGYDSPREFRLPDLRAMWGAVFVMGSVLYPYVYLTMRALFMSQPRQLLEAARTLGEGRWGAFLRVAWPLGRPALAVGLSLALLETLNDIGASEFLGVNTLTVAIYSTWVTRSDLAAAAQIACAMLFVVVVLMVLEAHGRRQQRFGTPRQMDGIRAVPLTGLTAWVVTAAVSLPVVLGFVAPAGYLLIDVTQRLASGQQLTVGLLNSLGNSLGLAAGVSIVVLGAGLVVAWADRRISTNSVAPGWMVRAASVGYAVPGSVLAIGILAPALFLDRAWAQAIGVPGLPLMGSGVILVVACVFRFMAMSAGGIAAGLTRIPVQIEQSSRSLGETAWGTLRRVHLPLLKPSLAAATLLVFVDAMKELPLTLLLRPVNFETLSTVLYGEAARGAYEEGALAALAIVLAGLLPVIWLARTQLHSHRFRKSPT